MSAEASQRRRPCVPNGSAPRAAGAARPADAAAKALMIGCGRLRAPAAVPVERLRELAGGTGFRTGLHYDGQDLHTVLNLAAAGHGLVLLPASAAKVVRGVPLSAPRVVHRVEVLYAASAGRAAALAAQLRRPPSSTPPGTSARGS